MLLVICKCIRAHKVCFSTREYSVLCMFSKWDKTFFAVAFLYLEHWTAIRTADLSRFLALLNSKTKTDLHVTMMGKVRMSNCHLLTEKRAIHGKCQLSILANKKVLFLKEIWSVPCTMNSSFFSQKMPYCLLTLLVYMALNRALKNKWVF